ncbi:MAG: 50S ribosomal protein L23 [Parcubacteria group bacterium]|nr:50S ribosomal protein L23 [Parcubacteria group bacterium]
MAFWNKLKFDKKPFKEPLEEKKEDFKIKKNIEALRETEESKKTTITKPAVKAKRELKEKTEEPIEAKKTEDQSVKSVRGDIGSKKIEKAKPTKRKKENTGDAFRILIRPIISEKVTKLGEINQYVFEIAPRANKSEVKKAIKNVYGVMPIKIRVIKTLGKKVRFGKNLGRLKDRKKAIITLKKGESIQIYEGV